MDTLPSTRDRNINYTEECEAPKGAPLAWLSKAVTTNPRLAYGQLYYAAIMAIRGDLSTARAALATAGRLNPNYTTLAKYRATDLSDDPAYVGQRAYVEEALRNAGLPEQ